MQVNVIKYSACLYTDLIINVRNLGTHTQRIRITEHPLQVHLFFAVWACLFLTHNAPASYAELMKSGRKTVKAKHAAMFETLKHEQNFL